MRRLHHGEQLREEIALDLDEIARAGAKRMLVEALEAEVRENTSKPRGASATREVAPWSSVTAMPESARSSWGREPWRSKLPGSTTAGWTKMATGTDSRA